MQAIEMWKNQKDNNETKCKHKNNKKRNEDYMQMFHK
tara:strand:+ start:1013 stop:1123 length:111 start_codon:yes stop_codon:yes gene_type:complete